MAGYANRVTTFKFPELSEEGDIIHVVIRNPKTVPVADLTPRDVPMDENGRPVNTTDSLTVGYESIAKLVIGWHVYDATQFELNEHGDPVDQEPLPLPATPELVAKLPSEIMTTIMESVSEAMNPR